MAAINTTTTSSTSEQPGPSPRFSANDVTVIFVLGGPGSGKGTQSAKIVADYGFTHLSAGDLLRAEQQREGSQYGDLIKSYIRDGKIVPMEITVGLLSNAIDDVINNRRYKTDKPRFLIDGFPRKMDQAKFFEDTVCVSTGTLFLSCPEDVLLERLLKRGETSGREDDNIESIRKRFRVFEEQSMPVVNLFTSEGKVLSVESVGSIEDIYAKIREGFDNFKIKPLDQ
ncbi:hypothetical protein KEM56_000123 [Ascosphaera pollenicola]|nr:hypothetical protein KEM56_000123 [Ascosphaera pollenicola]